MRRRLAPVLALAVAVAASSVAVANVSHAGWPAIDGIHPRVPNGGHNVVRGTALNDELLGRDGSDTIYGGAGNDVIWGDANPSGQPSSQRDVLYGGPGNDWIYTSHGRNVVHAGPGRDFVWAYYGHGTIDCGPGVDTVRVRTNGAYTLHGCERVLHFCTWGDDGHGGCLKPGARGARRQRGWG